MSQAAPVLTVDGSVDAAEGATPLATLEAWVLDAEEASADARALSERDRDYYDGKQFTAEEIRILRARGQPDIVINRIMPKINYLLGWEASNRTDPRAFPRTPQDEDASEAATDALRYVVDEAALQQLFSGVWENLLIEGAGGLELTIEMRERDARIVPVVWPWDRLFADPHSRRHDYSDARYLGGFLWMDVEDAIERWPEAAEAIETMVGEQSFSETYDDRPRKWVSRGTSDTSRRRVRIVQMYHRAHGQWWHCTFTKSVALERLKVPFVDQDGQSWCPLLMQSAFVNRQNERYGLVRSFVGVQDEINKRRSKALHRLTMRQVLTETGGVMDADGLKAELAKPDAVVEIVPGARFELLNGAEQLAAELSLLQEAKNEIEMLGPNAAMQGRDGDAPSGRAIAINQQSGQTEISLLVDRHRHLKKRTYQRLWDLIRQYKTEEWWVRVTDDEKNVRFVGFNRSVTMKDELAKRLAERGVPPEQVPVLLDQAAADPVYGPQLATVVRVENQPAQMHMDITIEEVPDSANVQMEQFEQLTKMAPAVVFPPEVYIEASSLRNKKRLLEIMQQGKGADPEQAEIARIAAQQTIEKTQAEIAKLKAEALKINVEADMADSQVGTAIVPEVVEAGARPGQAPGAAVSLESGVPAAGEQPGASAMPPPG